MEFMAYHVMKSSSSDGDISLTVHAPGLSALPARTRDSGFGASISSESEGVEPSTGLSASHEHVTSFCGPPSPCPSSLTDLPPPPSPLAGGEFFIPSSSSPSSAFSAPPSPGGEFPPPPSPLVNMEEFKFGGGQNLLRPPPPPVLPKPKPKKKPPVPAPKPAVSPPDVGCSPSVTTEKSSSETIHSPPDSSAFRPPNHPALAAPNASNFSSPRPSVSPPNAPTLPPKPPVLPPKPVQKAPVKPQKSTNFREEADDDTHSEVKKITLSSGMKNLMAELNSQLGHSATKAVECKSSNLSPTQPAFQCPEKTSVPDAQAPETVEMPTKFPNSFVATKKKKTLQQQRPQAPSPLNRSLTSPIFQNVTSSCSSSIASSSVGGLSSSSLDSSFNAPSPCPPHPTLNTQISAEDAVTSFQTGISLRDEPPALPPAPPRSNATPTTNPTTPKRAVLFLDECEDPEAHRSAFSRTTKSTTSILRTSNRSNTSTVSSTSTGSSCCPLTTPLLPKTASIAPRPTTPLMFSNTSESSNLPSPLSPSSTASFASSSFSSASYTLSVGSNCSSGGGNEFSQEGPARNNAVPAYDDVGAAPEEACDKCREGKCQTVYLHVPELPFGWEKVEDPHYGVYYIDHVNRRTQYENPVHTAKKQAGGDDVTHTFPRQKKSSEAGSTKRSASEHNMNGQVYNAGRAFFTKQPGELQGDFTQTSLVKSVRGLGFTIVGGHQRDTQFLQIKNVVENGPAYLNGNLKTGDVIVQVNNTLVLGYTHQDVVRLFQSIAPGETVQLMTCRGYPLNFDPDDPNTEIVTTVAVTLPQEMGSAHAPPASSANNINNGSSSNVVITNNNNNENGHGVNNPYQNQHLMKALPDLTHPAHGLNSTSSLSPSASHDETSGLMTRSADSSMPIPDLVSLSLNGGRPEVMTIGIVKGPMGFGFTIADSPYGQRVKQILDQGRCKTLAEGDLLLQINAVNVHELNHQQTVQVLKECPQGQETAVVVQRGGIPPPGKNKKNIKPSSSFTEQPSSSSLGSNQPGSYFFNSSQDQNFPDGDDASRGKPQRPKTPSDPSRSKTPSLPAHVQQGYMDMQHPARDYLDQGSKHSNQPDGRPPIGPGRPDYFPSRYGRGQDPFQRSYSSTSAPHPEDGRMGFGPGASRDAKPGQFRSRTPGPEMMARGGPGPDYMNSRPEVHRPKTPTAADMRGLTNGGRPPPSAARASGRYTPNPSSEQGRQYRAPYQDYGGPRSNNWSGPDVHSPTGGRRFEPFENPSLNRSYAGEGSRPPFYPGSRPVRQSTSFESEHPAPSSITRVPRRGPANFSGENRAPSRGPAGEEYVGEEDVMEMAVTLHRQENGYGFRIIGGTEEGSQVSVGHIVPGGAADMDGRLLQFDEITHVDGCSVLNASHHRVVQLMTNAALNGRVTLSIRRTLGAESPGSPGSGPQYPFDVVVSRRENEGFGFVIISSVNKNGASVDEYIGHIQEHSPAARCGRLHVGDRILAVNGVDTSCMHHKDVVGLIKESGFSVALTVGPPPDDSSSSNSQRSSQGSMGTTTGHPAGDRPDLSGNIHSWERNQPGMAGGLFRQRVPSNQGSDDSGEIYSVELHRGSRGFGFSIRGGREFNSMPLFVLRIADGGAADQEGRLRVGDQILEINNFNTDSMTHTEAIEIIQNGGPSVRLLMRRTNKPPPIFEGPASPAATPTSALFPPASSNGPISHSSPHLARRQPQLPPPPPADPQADDYFSNYPPPPSSTTASQQHLRFNNY